MLTGSIFVLFLALLVVYYLGSDYDDNQPFIYKSYGSIDKDTIVVIPGLDGATAFFADVIPELTVNYHVVLFYIPLLPDGLNVSEYTFEYMATKLTYVLDELQVQSANIVGESFGGIIGQHFAFMYPERVSKLVLFSSLAKTQLPPEIEWKVQNLLPVVSFLGKLHPSWAQGLFAYLHADDVVEPSEPMYVIPLKNIHALNIWI
jgi:pimeloyl-ACP methyl ester carboxylesterase